MSEEKEQQPSIQVPIDDLDTVSEKENNTLDQLSMELATIKQSAKRIAIIETCLSLTNSLLKLWQRHLLNRAML